MMTSFIWTPSDADPAFFWMWSPEDLKGDCCHVDYILIGSTEFKTQLGTKVEIKDLGSATA
jgi:hypothetical protein